MRRFSPRAVLTALLVGLGPLVGSGASCSSSVLSDAPTDAPVAEVDSLDAPAEIASSDTLSVHLYGLVGPNGCYSLDRIEEERTPGRVTLRPVVHHRTGGACTMALVALDERHRVVPPFEKGSLEIVVPQPDRPDVTAQVTVH